MNEIENGYRLKVPKEWIHCAVHVHTFKAVFRKFTFPPNMDEGDLAEILKFDFRAELFSTGVPLEEIGDSIEMVFRDEFNATMFKLTYRDHFSND